MAERAHVLVQTAPGRAKEALSTIKSLKIKNARLLAADAVTGPYDLVVTLQAEDINALGTAVAEGIQNVDGVTRTTTCVVVEIL